MTICIETERQEFFKKLNNSYWNPKLKIKVLPSGDRTVIATDQIRDREPLVIFNKDTAFGPEQATAHSKENLNTLNSNLIISAYLYQYYTKHTESFPFGYDHYFNSLPTYEWYKNNHEFIKFYLSLDKNQKDKLKEDSYLLTNLEALIEWVKQIPKHKPNIEEAIRSYLITTTRSWSSFGLVPWIDFFNHSDQGSFLNEEGTSIHATHAYEKGDEVNTSYGLKDTLHLLTTYGYVAKETTVSLLCPPVSKFALAFDPNLNNLATLSEGYPFLVKKNVNNFNQIISYFRLCAFNKHDLFFVNDIATESKRFINGENEHKAVKIGLFCLEKSKKSLENVKNNFDSISKELPESFVKEFEGKMEILKELSLKFHTHWLNLLDKTN